MILSVAFYIQKLFQAENMELVIIYNAMFQTIPNSQEYRFNIFCCVIHFPIHEDFQGGSGAEPGWVRLPPEYMKHSNGNIMAFFLNTFKIHFRQRNLTYLTALWLGICLILKEHLTNLRSGKISMSYKSIVFNVWVRYFVSISKMPFVIIHRILYPCIQNLRYCKHFQNFPALEIFRVIEGCKKWDFVVEIMQR